VTGLRLFGAVALLVIGAVGWAGSPAVLPALTFEDQQGGTVHLGALRGRVVVIVYGTREGVDDHVAWGRRLEGRLVAQGLYHADDPPEQRPVRILAVAQMGGIPESFRSLISALVRGHTPASFSLYLDWQDRMSRLFGAPGSLSTVLVSDRAGVVRLVTAGPPTPEALQTVIEVIRRLA